MDEKCLALYGGPIEPNLAVGGYPSQGDNRYSQAEALIITFLVNNYLDPDKVKIAMDWESK